MRVTLDGIETPAPAAETLGELFDGVSPLLDPARLVTRLAVDGADADPTDARALAARRLTGAETIEIVTESMVEFARSRRAETAGHLRRIADLLALAADGLVAGQTVDANTVLAVATRELALVLQLDEELSRLDPDASACGQVLEAVGRVGVQLTDAERDHRWRDVAALLRDELVPALRADGSRG